MKKFSFVYWLAAGALLFALAGCGSTTSPVSPSNSLDSAPPAAPSGLAVALDTNGARALSWAPNGEPDLGSYQVYQYSPSPTRDNAYVLVGTVGSATCTWTLPTVGADTPTYFKLSAVDQNGNRSAQSAPLAVLLLPSGMGPEPPSNDPSMRRH